VVFRLTCVGVQASAPRAVGMPCSFSALAIPDSVITPAPKTGGGEHAIRRASRAAEHELRERDAFRLGQHMNVARRRRAGWSRPRSPPDPLGTCRTCRSLPRTLQFVYRGSTRGAERARASARSARGPGRNSYSSALSGTPIAHPHRGDGGRAGEADRTSIEAQIIPVLCKRLWTIGSVAGHATCLGQAKSVVDEVFM
jgi:hypothetical protein